MYQALGGKAGCRRLAVAFYTRVGRDPVLRPLFPGKSFTCAIEEFAAFLAQFLGGPSEDSQRRWWLSLGESHHRFKIGARERTAWLANMAAAFDDVQLAEPLRGELLRFFESSSRYVVNQEAVQPAAAAIDHTELAHRWETQLQLDKAVAAIRAAKAPEALKSYGPSIRCGLIGMMIRSSSANFFDQVRTSLIDDPALVRERFAGRTLLHDAAAAGDLEVVELLLSLGADPNSQDGGGHTPLYSVGNECAAEQGPSVVRLLVKAGCDVDADAGVKKCTPLHMAARRDNVKVAQALLDCGANIEARDSMRETPLRRAVNCNQIPVASLLLARGANVRSIGSKGLTPVNAARSTGMKELLRAHF